MCLFNSFSSGFIMKRFSTFIGLALGAAVLATPAAEADDQAFGDWVLHCADVSDGEKACALHQKIMSQDTKLPVASFAIARNKDSRELRLAVVLPLGVDIPAGVSGKVGEVALTFALQTCVKRGCIANTLVDDRLLEKLHATDSFTTTFKMRSVADPTTLTVSLKGFHAALTALESK
jgi:invasion protein IalB